MDFRKLLKKYGNYLPYVAWFQSFAAVLGSLYASEISGLVPCLLCWYQRIFMYPILFIVTVGILRRDKNYSSYVLPLSIPGLMIAAYHYLLQMGVFPKSAAPCVAGVSCTVKEIEWFGFVTIPFLSICAFAVITLSMIFFRLYTKYADK